MDREQLRRDLVRDEGWSPHVYEDTEGFQTIGIGFLVDPKKGGEGLPRFIADQWLDYLIAKKHGELRARWPAFDDQPAEVKRALLNMVYQLGVAGVMGFRKMIAALERRDRPEAARQALDSLYARQTPNRARRVAALIRGSEK